MHTSALILVLLIAYASASTGYQKANSTTRSSSSNRDPVTAKSSRSDFQHHGYEHHYPHHYGGYGGHLGGFGHHKDFEHYLLPLLLVLGLGVLCMPLLSVLMTTMVGNVPVTTLVSGRKRRETPLNPFDEETLMKLWKKVGQAIEIFTKKDK